MTANEDWSLTPTVAPATGANRRRYDERSARLAGEVVRRLPDLPADVLDALAYAVLLEYYRRRRG